MKHQGASPGQQALAEINQTIALGALTAARAFVGEDIVELIFAHNAQAAAFGVAAVHYLTAAPKAAGGDVFRFAAAKGLHLLPVPAPGESVGSDDIVQFFDAFTGAAKGLIGVFLTKPEPHRVLRPAIMPAPAYDNALTDRVDDDDSEGRTESTGSIRVIVAAPGPAAPAPVAPLNLAAFKDMPPEARRQFAQMFGFGEANEDFLAKLQKGAPLIETQAPEPARVITAESFEPEPGDDEPAERPAKRPAKAKAKKDDEA